MEGRQKRGIEIALRGGITKGMKGYIVPSQYGSDRYIVRTGADANCTCPDCQTRGVKCKHQYAVEYFIQRVQDQAGNTITTKVVRKTYPQNWKAYTTAQTKEIELFDKLLSELVSGIDEPQQKMGRPKLTTQNLLFCSIQKVYSQLSSRRARTLYQNANLRDQIEKAPNYNSINIFLNREDITPLLHDLLALSALPLKGVETSFAIDSSGFSTTQFGMYNVLKHKDRKYHRWVKAHIMVGTKTNVITSARITEENGADSPQFNPLVMESHERGFMVKEVTADKAYSSRDNIKLVDDIEGVAYIPFKSNASGKFRGASVWYKMYHYFQFNRDEFMEHYHKRSNVETAFHMVKSKFGDKLKSKKYVSQQNELLCKLIAHNIVVLIHEMHELGIKPEFSTLSTKEDIQ